MDFALNNAIAEKTKLQGEIAALQERLRRVETFIAMHREFSAPPALPMPPPLSISDAFLGKRQSIPDAVAQMLAGGLPMTTPDILSKLDTIGVVVGGDEYSKRITNLSSSLSRDKRFKNERGRGWSLVPIQKVESPFPVGAGDGLDDL